MDIPAKKLELINWITNLEDPALLEDLQSLKDLCQNAEVSWDDLPEEAKKSIDRGLEDSKAGRLTPHEEVRKIYEKWL